MESIEEKQKQFVDAMAKHRGSDIPQRVAAYVLEQKGKPIRDYLSNGAPMEDKLALLDTLTSIITEERWDDLPSAPGGQASASTPTPKPKLQPAAAPAPKLVQSDPVAPIPEPTPAAAQPAPDAMAVLAQLAALLQPKPSAPSAPSVSKEEIRAMIREELADFFALASERFGTVTEEPADAADE